LSIENSDANENNSYLNWHFISIKKVTVYKIAFN